MPPRLPIAIRRSFSDLHPQPQISRREWDLRTGRAIYVLTQTLPSFFSNGLISSPDHPALSPFPSHFTPSSHQNGEDSIYANNIRLTYTPPMPLPPPFPQTLHIEGIPLYMASSVFVRHTLNALYSDLHVELRRVNVLGSSSTRGPSLSLSAGEKGTPESGETEDTAEEEQGTQTEKSRDKSVFIGLCVRGTARVSGGVGQWDVNSTYTFSPYTGLIYLHTINSIHPAPHEAVYDAMRTSLGRVFGLGGAGVAERIGMKGGQDGRA